MSEASADLRRRLLDGPPLLLDGATGTELHRRGVDTALPLWSAAALIDAPEVLSEIHRDYVAAGAEIITANTFRTHHRSLAAGGVGERAAELTALAVEIARSAARPGEEKGREQPPTGSTVRPGSPVPEVFIAGSLAPLEDCYSPELVPDDASLAAEHALMAGWLASAGVDLLLVETMNSIREAVAAASAAVDTGLPTLAGLVCGRDGRLLSGESVAEAGRALAAVGVDGVVVNCAPAPDLHDPLGELMSAIDLPTGAYGNVGYADDDHGWVNTDSVDPEAYARYADGWLGLGARIVGSCCGTGPQHTRALRRLIDSRAAR